MPALAVDSRRGRGRAASRRRRAVAGGEAPARAPPQAHGALADPVAAVVARLPACELPPTASPLLRAMHQAACHFYALEAGSVRSPREATTIDETAVSAIVVASAAERAPTKPEAEALVATAEVLVASSRLSIAQALAAKAPPRRRLQMCDDGAPGAP